MSKHHNYFLKATLAVAVVSLLLFMGLAQAPGVSATPSINILPNFGPENTTVLIRGSGFTPYSSITYQYTNPTTGANGAGGGGGSAWFADSTGNVSMTLSIKYPDVSGDIIGVFNFRILDVSSATYSNYVSFWVAGAFTPGGTRVDHAAINISSNADFDAAHGVNGGGDGSAATPYIIENWAFDCSSDNGINISNTTTYFIIRNCLFENDASHTYYGIALYNAPYGVIKYNVFQGGELWSAVRLHNTQYDNVSNNTANTYKRTVLVNDSSHLVIAFNNLTINEAGGDSIWLSCDTSTPPTKVFDILIIGNTMHTTAATASNITIGGTSLPSGYNYTNPENIIIANNILGGIGVNVYVGPENFGTNEQINIYTLNNISENSQFSQGSIFLRSSHNTIQGNLIRNNATHGIYIDGQYKYPCYYNFVENNSIDNNTYGIYITNTWTGYNTITRNHIRNNTTANAYDDRTTDNWDYGGYGNYWSDWQTPDTALPIGIVDTARAIAGGSLQDSYPLVEGYTPPEVRPTLSISPTSGAVGTTVTFTGSGFSPNSYALIYGYSTTILPITVATDASGNFTYQTQLFSNGVFWAVDNTTLVQSSTVTFTRTGGDNDIYTIYVTPTTVTYGTTITIVGRGFSPNSFVYTFLPQQYGNFSVPASTDSSGNFTVTYTFVANETPAGTFDVYTLDSITSNTSNIVTITFVSTGPGDIDIIGLFTPLTGGNRTTAGFVAGLILLVIPLSLLGLAMVAGGRVKTDSAYVLMMFAFGGMALATVTGMWPWWIVISIFAVVALLLARKWF